MSKYRCVEVVEPGGSLGLVERELVEPGFGQVRVTVEACGVCHTDSEFVQGHLPGLSFPLTPGHEVAGRIDVVGAGVRRWSVGDRVTVGWSGGQCGYCDPCRRGEFVHCEEGYTTGATYPGGYAESMVVPASALARIPEKLSAADAAPMACAGVTMFNSLRRSTARPGDLVAILGLGGLGHLGVQFAVKMSFRTQIHRRTPRRGRDRRRGHSELRRSAPASTHHRTGPTRPHQPTHGHQLSPLPHDPQNQPPTTNHTKHPAPG